LIFRAVVE